ncbi:hypothetical protein ACN08N_26995 (plasmid) [Photobacterium leiognathi subsp. mandapamensis]|uniref:hypothetical protein n=1 Tax=Photobacterium leiognathi TaxID=553611 RepID=UPI0027394C57|nr:hypothetical protein [Photobacterium leiognathi]
MENKKTCNHVYMGKHAYRLVKEEIGLKTQRHSVKYKGVTITFLEHLNSGQICTNLIKFDDFNHELCMHQINSRSGSRTLRIVKRVLHHIETTEKSMDS